MGFPVIWNRNRSPFGSKAFGWKSYGWFTLAVDSGLPLMLGGLLPVALGVLGVLGVLLPVVLAALLLGALLLVVIPPGATTAVIDFPNKSPLPQPATARETMNTVMPGRAMSLADVSSELNKMANLDPVLGWRMSCHDPEVEARS